MGVAPRMPSGSTARPAAVLCAIGAWEPGDQYRIARSYTPSVVAEDDNKNATLTFSGAKKVKIAAKMKARNCSCTLRLDGSPVMTLNGAGGDAGEPRTVTNETEIEVNVGSVLSASGASLGGDSYFLMVAEVFA